MKSENSLSRRDFVQLGALAAGVLAGGSLVACSPTQPSGGEGAAEGGDKKSEPVALALSEGALPDGEWKAAKCWTNCGGSCVNTMFVSDGVVLFQGTDETGDDSIEQAQRRSCARGHSMRKWVFGEDRLKYPLKRKSWQPGGGANINGQLRGVDEWERISWDDAFDMIASEYNRVCDEVGPSGVVSAGYPWHPLGPSRGCATLWGNQSFGGFNAAGGAMLGTSDVYTCTSTSDRFQFQKSKLIVLWANDPVETTQSVVVRSLMAAKEAGAKIITVDPVYTKTAQLLADDWVPVRPGTDNALLLAMAYVMIENDLQDQEFLDTYTSGFDADHMPEGADPKANFKDHVLGTYDGVPKTPEWASAICGTPVEQIVSFAKEVATTKPVAFQASRKPGRYAFGEQFLQAYLTVGWMTGNVGKDGAMVGYTHMTQAGIGGVGAGYHLVNAGAAPAPVSSNVLNSELPGGSAGYYAYGMVGNSYAICQHELWDAILEGEFTAGTAGKKPIDIRMMCMLGSYGNFLNQLPNAMRGIEAMRSLECVVSTGMAMKSQSQYADIVLPQCSDLELVGNRAYTKMDNETLLLTQQICEPLFESKTPDEINLGLGLRLGLSEQDIMPVSEAQAAFATLAGATVNNGKGEKVPLFTIAEEDIPEGVEAEPQEGQVPLSQFLEDKIYRVPVEADGPFTYIALKDYVDDPVANPRQSASGKLEIYSEALKANVDDWGFNAEPWSATPTYVPSPEGYETAQGSDYPLQLFAVHGFRCAHSAYDQVPWLKEAFPSDAMMNPVDADARGLKDGDAVLIESRWGKVLRHVQVTEAIMPGCVRIVQGHWIDIDPETGIDRGGNMNVLVGTHLESSGTGTQQYDTCNVQISKYTGEYASDVERPLVIVEV